MIEHKNTLCMSVATIALLAGTAQAATIPYGDFNGSTVMYLGVTEDTRELPGALFGIPSVTGDTLDFDPQSFSSESSGLASEIVDAQLNFTAMDTSGNGISQISVTERGDFTLSGLAGEAVATIGAPVFISIIEVDSGPLANPIDWSGALTFTSDGDFFLTEEGIGTGQFTGSLLIDIAQILADAGVSGNVTKLEFAMDNTLSTASVEGTSAFIAKKDADGVVITIPEPGSLALVAAGSLLIARRRRA